MAKSLFPLANLPAGGLCAARAPVREPEPLPGSRSKEPASPRSLDCVRDRSHRHDRVPGWPRAPPPAGLTPRPAGQCPNHIQGGNRSRIQAPAPRSHHVPGGQQSPHLHRESLAPVPQTSCSRSHSAPTKQPPVLPLGSSASPKPDHDEFRQHQHGRASVAAPSTGCSGRNAPSSALCRASSEWDGMLGSCGRSRAEPPVPPGWNGPSMLQQPFHAPTAPLRSGCAGRGARQSLTGAAPKFA